MKPFILAAFAAFTACLAGCTTASQSNLVASITKGCQGEAALFQSYVSLVESGVIKSSKQVVAADAGLKTICANPAGMADPYTALAQLTAATIVVTSALKAAS